MATSDFWRELAVQFRAIPDFGELRADWRTVGSGARRWEVKSPTPFLKDTFEDFARKAASEIADAGVSDLLVTWLEALKDDGYNVQSGGHLTGSIYRLCEASANFCKKLEIRASHQTEFEEKQPAVALVPTPEPEPDSTSEPRSPKASPTPQYTSQFGRVAPPARSGSRMPPSQTSESIELDRQLVETRAHIRRLRVLLTARPNSPVVKADRTLLLNFYAATEQNLLAELKLRHCDDVIHEMRSIIAGRLSLAQARFFRTRRLFGLDESRLHDKLRKMLQNIETRKADLRKWVDAWETEELPAWQKVVAEIKRRNMGRQELEPEPDRPVTPTTVRAAKPTRYQHALQEIAGIWDDHPNESYTMICDLAIKANVATPWDAYPDWSNAMADNESACKTLLAKARAISKKRAG